MRRATFPILRKNRRVGSVVGVGKTVKAAESAGRGILRSLGIKKNVAAGFWDDSGFHPIRASYDYDKSRVGEKRSRPHKRTRATGRRAGFGGRVRNKRKKNLNFGQRMARLRARKRRR